jgi:hypothetical protein
MEDHYKQADMGGIDSHIVSSAIPLILGAILILDAWADFLLFRGSGFLSANALHDKIITKRKKDSVRTSYENFGKDIRCLLYVYCNKKIYFSSAVKLEIIIS